MVYNEDWAGIHDDMKYHDGSSPPTAKVDKIVASTNESRE